MEIEDTKRKIKGGRDEESLWKRRDVKSCHLEKKYSKMSGERAAT